MPIIRHVDEFDGVERLINQVERPPLQGLMCDSNFILADATLQYILASTQTMTQHSTSSKSQAILGEVEVHGVVL